MRRIQARFAELAEADRAGFVAYVMAGDPDRDRSLEILRGLSAAGADMIELGFPFSDPMAEGPPIQRAARRALDAGMSLGGALDLVHRFRRDDEATPLILMGYLNPILAFGPEALARESAASGVDGLIVVDCPPEEADVLAAVGAEDMALIRLIAPTTGEARLTAIVREAQGFVYYVSVAGVTGEKEADAEAIAVSVARLREISGLPVAVGFGVRTVERAAAIARIADAVVVGSALVDEVAAALAQNRDPAAKVLATVASLSKSVRGARL
ncbi:MAG: tryptophan synthase subunit alpha [Caulobacteraceae bacterium]